MESNLELSKIKKKEHVLQEGEICSTMCFVTKGCLRQYIINAKGTEQTLQFAIENWWITDYLSYHNNVPSNFYIQAIDNSEIIGIEKPVFESLLIQIPKLERYFRIVSQNHLVLLKCALNSYLQCQQKNGTIILKTKILNL